MNERLLSIEDIWAIPHSKLPMVVLCNGYTSVFGFMISLFLKDFWNHAQWLINPRVFATQWFWFKLAPVSKKFIGCHSLKLWHNPRWTDEERRILQNAIADRLRLGIWKTRYDILAVIGEALGTQWSEKGVDFCSEAVANMLSLVDPEIKKWDRFEKSPTPEELNTWLKAQKNEDGTPRYEVYGRVQPG